MRAVAVLLVVVGHLGGLGMPGGFIGVDVFFVVSGFLITLLLLREVAEGGTVSLVGFYARRARRILPAATLVILATVVGSLVLLPMTQGVEVMDDAVWTSLFLANVRFAQTGSDYFAQDQATSPLQHYWSLSVEEQFYVVWPVVVLVWVWWASRRAARRAVEAPGGPVDGPSRLPLRSLGLVLALAAIASLAWSIHATAASPESAYFSTFTRAWELIAGAAAAVVVAAGWQVRSAAVRAVVGLLGLGAIVVGAVIFDGTTPFPGTAALVPVLGTVALLVSGGSGTEGPVARLLGVKPLRAIGDWSFSLYLWHWPVIILVRGRWGEDVLDPLWAKVALIGGVLVISWATYRWVETPFRQHTFWRPNWRSVLVYPLSVACVIVATVAGPPLLGQAGDGTGAPITVAENDPLLRKLGPERAMVSASVGAAEQGHAIPASLRPPLMKISGSRGNLACNRVETREVCPMGDLDSDIDVVLYGDSHALAWSPAIEELSTRHGVRLHTFAQTGCKVLDLSTKLRADENWESCREFQEWVYGQLDTLKPDLVLVTSWVPGYVANAEGELVGRDDPKQFHELFREGFRGPARQLLKRADRVVAFAGTPRVPESVADCLTTRDANLGDCLFAPDQFTRDLNADIAAVAAQEGADYVDVNDFFCEAGRCPAVIGDYVAIRDTHHVMPQYAKHISEAVGRRFGGPFAAKKTDRGRQAVGR